MAIVALETTRHKNYILRGGYMKRMFATCGNCSGVGKTTTWTVVDLDDMTGTMQKEENFCTQCNGKGYIEYAVFSVEEAEAILKHCGLTTES